MPTIERVFSKPISVFYRQCTVDPASSAHAPDILMTVRRVEVATVEELAALESHPDWKTPCFEGCATGRCKREPLPDLGSPTLQVLAVIGVRLGFWKEADAKPVRQQNPEQPSEVRDCEQCGRQWRAPIVSGFLKCPVCRRNAKRS